MKQEDSFILEADHEWLIPPGALTLVLPHSGEERYVKWFDRDHVQFWGGRSCSRRHIKMFYGPAGVEALINWKKSHKNRKETLTSV